MTPDGALGGFLDSYLSQQPAAEAAGPAEDVRPGEWRGVWTWMELVDGEVLPASLEILGRGREIAEELGTRNVAVLFGHGVEAGATRLGQHGADRVLVVDRAELGEFTLKLAREALVALIRDRRPEALLLPATIQGRNLGAQVAAALQCGIVPNCKALTLDPTERLLIGHQTSYDERLLMEVVCPADRPQIFTVTPGSFRRPPHDPSRKATVIGFEPPPPRSPARVKLLGKEPERPRTIGQYDALVVAGLGMASQEGFDVALQLAKELDAYAGVTRSAVACGWADPSRLITFTKHRLRPRLYIACGVLGEYDHLKAIEGADYVIALSDVASAPIVENADLVGIGEPTELLRRVVQQLRQAKQDRPVVK